MARFIENPEKDADLAVRNAQRNARRLEASVPKQIQEDEALLPSLIPNSGTTPMEQLRELHRLSIAPYAAMQPFTACRHGCSLCCHYAVMVYPIEAELIAQAIGQPPAAMPQARSDGHGKRCPFLTEEGRCGIYAVRPMACRRHTMVTNSNYWCHPVRSHERSFPLARLTGVDMAFQGVVAHDGRARPQDLRDIRDHFKLP